jgi:peptide/nickel transport system permease protein
MLIRYVINRLFQLVPVLFLVSVVVFLIVHLIPGDPVLVMLGVDAEGGASYSEEQYRALRRQLGLDQPLPIQYANWLNRILHGDFGLSIQSGRPVIDLILERYPATIYLALSALVVGLLIAVPAGIAAAVRQNTAVDYFAMGFALWGVAMPNFWLGLLLILGFSLKLGWFPAIGYASPFVNPVAFLQHVFLPALVLGASMAAQLTRYMRAEMLEQLKQDYVRTARAKGLPSRLVIRHAVQNSLLAVVTVLGLQVARLLGGSTIVELVFTWPGVALLLLEGIYGRDFPVVQGAVLFLAVTYVCINLMVDLVYKWIDPRVKLE